MGAIGHGLRDTTSCFFFIQKVYNVNFKRFDLIFLLYHYAQYICIHYNFFYRDAHPLRKAFELICLECIYHYSWLCPSPRLSSPFQPQQYSSRSILPAALTKIVSSHLLQLHCPTSLPLNTDKLIQINESRYRIVPYPEHR